MNRVFITTTQFVREDSNTVPIIDGVFTTLENAQKSTMNWCRSQGLPMITNGGVADDFWYAIFDHGDGKRLRVYVQGYAIQG